MHVTRVKIYLPDGSQVELAEGPTNRLKVTVDVDGDSIELENENGETVDKFHGMPWHLVWRKPKPNEERWDEKPPSP
ncbi:MAG TPA: hypothetical protein VFG23_15990 [Polyangia bacterium]|nr:hypothetical protein [Polyangia bacterium]